MLNISPVQLDEGLHDALCLFSKTTGFLFNISGSPGFEFTPKKPNTARTVRDVFMGKQQVGTLYAILFAPMDGTGDESTYKVGSVQIPSELNAYEPQRLMPRRKDGILAEGYFPLATFLDKSTHIGAGGLDELTLNGQNLQIGWRLGYSDVLTAHNPEIFYTTGNFPQGIRFGDPHSIVNTSSHYQLAGFLAIKKEQLLAVANGWKYPSILLK